jgi:inhibitor of nuclear factor kappa-B kinase subunit alpha
MYRRENPSGRIHGLMRPSPWVRTNFRKEDTLKILFSDEKFFGIDGVHNSQNDRVWAVDRADVDKKGGIQQKRKFPQKLMVWLGACSKGVTTLVILDEETVDHSVCIEKVLPVALKYVNQVFGSDWVFQQDGTKPHSHHLTQQWCQDSFPSFIDKDQWPANSPDLNPLDYSIWDEFVNNIKWEKVTSKSTLIQQLKSSYKNIREPVAFESCAS